MGTCPICMAKMELKHNFADNDGELVLVDVRCSECGAVIDVCKWHCEDDDYGYWATGCSETFEFSALGPKENGFEFCPYCGRILVVVSSDDD